MALAVAPADYQQGEAARIMYVHVPAAWNAFIAFFVVAVSSLLYLWKGQERHDLLLEIIDLFGAQVVAPRTIDDQAGNVGLNHTFITIGEHDEAFHSLGRYCVGVETFSTTRTSCSARYWVRYVGSALRRATHLRHICGALLGHDAQRPAHMRRICGAYALTGSHPYDPANFPSSGK